MSDSQMVEITPPKYFMTLLDETGDTAITWSEPDDVDVLTFIQEKIDAGYTFFIERPVIIRAFMNKKQITDIEQIKTRRLLVADDKATELILTGKITMTKLERKEFAPVRKAKDAMEIATSRSYALRPLAGG